VSREGCWTLSNNFQNLVDPTLRQSWDLKWNNPLIPSCVKSGRRVEVFGNVRPPERGPLVVLRLAKSIAIIARVSDYLTDSISISELVLFMTCVPTPPWALASLSSCHAYPNTMSAAARYVHMERCQTHIPSCG